MFKLCYNCNIELPMESFSNKTKAKDGKCSICKSCSKIKIKLWLSENSDRNKEQKKRYREENKIRISESKKIERAKNAQKNRDRANRYRVENREAVLKKKREYYLKNKESHRKRMNEWEKNKRKNDPIFRLIKNHRDRVRKSCKGSEINISKIKYLGCSSEEFKNHLETQFIDGMGWDNYGVVWNVDHKIPISWFNLSNENCRLSAFNFMNTQPMYVLDNSKKSNKFYHV